MTFGGTESFLDAAERRVMNRLVGTRHPSYRQAIWRPSRQPAEGLNLSDNFAGNPNVRRNPRYWESLGVLAVRPGALADLREAHADEGPLTLALMYTTPKGGIWAGRLASEEEMGTALVGGQAWDAHGMRLGRDDFQIGIGYRTAEKKLWTPSSDDLITMGPIPVEIVGQVGTGYAALRFS